MYQASNVRSWGQCRSRLADVRWLIPGMLTLFHHPFCPHSRFVRLVLEELGQTPRLVEERTWERRQDFLVLNPAGTTPVLVEEGAPPVPGAAVIAEYLAETRGGKLAELGLLPPRDRRPRRSPPPDAIGSTTSSSRKSRGALVMERIYKRYIPAAQGGGPPDTDTLRAARVNIRYHLAYIGWLVRTRDWLAGESLTFADLAAAAHLSVADYLGEVPWDEDKTARAWYARIKSRPSFRALLTETLAGLQPAPSYADLDF